MRSLGSIVIAVALGCSGASDDPIHVVDAGPDAAPDAPCREICCDRAVAICCNPVAPEGQQGCATGQKCGWVIWQGEPDPLGRVGCVPDGPQPIGDDCTYGAPGPTTGFDDCAVGSVCINGTCRDVCSDDVGPLYQCAAGHVCLEHDGVFANDGEPPAFGACEPAPPP